MKSVAEMKFGSTICDPVAWRTTATNLVAAASVLEPAFERFWNQRKVGGLWDDGQIAIYFMLCAFALENLMKARLIERMIVEGSLSPATESFPKELKDHDLINLTQRCGEPELAEEHSSILQRLSRSAVWYGRYPVPISPKDMNSLSMSPNGEPVSLREYSSEDRDDVMYLLKEFGFVSV